MFLIGYSQGHNIPLEKYFLQLSWVLKLQKCIFWNSPNASKTSRSSVTQNATEAAHSAAEGAPSEFMGCKGEWSEPLYCGTQMRPRRRIAPPRELQRGSGGTGKFYAKLHAAGSENDILAIKSSFFIKKQRTQVLSSIPQFCNVDYCNVDYCWARSALSKFWIEWFSAV